MNHPHPAPAKRSLRMLLCALCLSAFAGSAAGAMRPAFYYGPMPFPQTLRSFDTWVVEPDQIKDAQDIARQQDTLFAYVGVGEVGPGRAYRSKLPATWLRGDNKTWNSRVIDQAAPGWPAFFVNEIVAPLWQRGYRNFFLDTLDSYHLIATTPEARQQQ